MISIIKGTVESIGKDSAVVLTEGGVGYEVRVETGNWKLEIGETVKLFTYLKVSDRALDLYGFATVVEREFFELLTTVSGVGPKSAMHIMSAGSLREIQAAIARGDAAHLSSVPGIGKKTAERLVVELHSKIGLRTTDYGLRTESVVAGEVIEALAGLGYAREDAKLTVMRLESAGKTTEELLKLALREMR